MCLLRIVIHQKREHRTKPVGTGDIAKFRKPCVDFFRLQSASGLRVNCLLQRERLRVGRRFAAEQLFEELIAINGSGMLPFGRTLQTVIAGDQQHMAGGGMSLQPSFDELIGISRCGGEKHGQALFILLARCIRRRVRRIKHNRCSRDLIRPQMFQQQLQQPVSTAMQISRPVTSFRQSGRVQ